MHTEIQPQIRIVGAVKSENLVRFSFKIFHLILGSVIQNPKTKKWHLFVSEFCNCCGAEHYYPNSQIVEAISEKPDGKLTPFWAHFQLDLSHFLGPYKKRRVLFPPFHYNPKVVLSSDGTFVLYFVGNVYTDPLYNCCKSINIFQTISLYFFILIWRYYVL